MQLKVELWPEAALFTTKVTATVSRLEDCVQPAFATYVRKKNLLSGSADLFVHHRNTNTQEQSHPCRLMSADTIVCILSQTQSDVLFIANPEKR